MQFVRPRSRLINVIVCLENTEPRDCWRFADHILILCDVFGPNILKAAFKDIMKIDSGAFVSLVNYLSIDRQ